MRPPVSAAKMPGFVGQAILPAAAFQAAFSDHVRIFATGESRLKAARIGCPTV
jgi:hypothetical protein